ncbi:MAG: NUDIX domain-containing protein [Planctomycetota bacterium]
MNGPRIRSDIADLYIFRRKPGVEFLQLRRVGGSSHGTWHPVMGRIEAGETAPQAMLREANEETGLTPDFILGFWALGTAFPAYLPPRDTGEDECVLLAPRLAAEVKPGWEPVLNDEHDAQRWISAEDADGMFMWPTQRAAVRELLEMLKPGSLAEPGLRLSIPNR